MGLLPNLGLLDEGFLCLGFSAEALSSGDLTVGLLAVGLCSVDLSLETRGSGKASSLIRDCQLWGTALVLPAKGLTYSQPSGSLMCGC